MSFDNDVLRPVTAEELKQLLVLYKENKLDFQHLEIYNQIKWNGKMQEFKSDIDWTPVQKYFYTHRDGNLMINGTFVSITIDLKTHISFHTLESSPFKELHECLLKTERIDWKSGPLVTGVLLNYVPMLYEIVNERGGKLKDGRHSMCYSMSNQDGKSSLMSMDEKLPESYEVRKLKLENADMIYKEWPHRHEASVDFVRCLILLNKAYGIFNGTNLVAWIIQNEYSGLGMLQVIPAERKRGLAMVLVKKLTKHICDTESINCTAFIIRENQKSRQLFAKLGFQQIVETMWIEFEDFSIQYE